MSVLKQIKNISDHAVRFSALIVFMPGETTAISEEDYKAYPSIELLIKQGVLKEVVKSKKKDTKEEDIEEI